VLLFGVRGNNDVEECGLRPSVLFSVCGKDFEKRGDDETVLLFGVCGVLTLRIEGACWNRRFSAAGIALTSVFG
jgi:hypothetical protein